LSEIPSKPGKEALSSFKRISGKLFLRSPPTRAQAFGPTCSGLLSSMEALNTLRLADQNREIWCLVFLKRLALVCYKVQSEPASAEEKGFHSVMKQLFFPSKSRIQVTSYGPFRGLKGTIQHVDTIVDDRDEPFRFYLISLEGAFLQEPVWFEHHEIEFIDFFPDVSQPQMELVHWCGLDIL
jgi:hypothetical protein